MQLLLACLFTQAFAADQPPISKIDITVTADLQGKSVDAECTIKSEAGEWITKNTPATLSILEDERFLAITCKTNKDKVGRLIVLANMNAEDSSTPLWGGALLGGILFGPIGGAIGGAIQGSNSYETNMSSAQHHPTLKVELGKTVIVGDLVPKDKMEGDYEYGVMEQSNGFIVSTYSSRYQFIPDRDEVAKTCVDAVGKIAKEYALKIKNPISEINDKDIKTRTHRNGVTGTTYCQSSLTVTFIQSSADEGGTDQSNEDRISELRRLWKNGAITQKEYNQKRKAILDQM